MTLPQTRQFRTIAYSNEPMADPGLIFRLRNQGVTLEETKLGVLGINPFDLKRLEEAGIHTLAQLACWHDSDILTIPHFGIIKVRLIKTLLRSYLLAFLDEPAKENQEYQIQDKDSIDFPDPDQIDVPSPPRLNLRIELEAFSKSLDKLKKRLGLLESKLAKTIPE